MISICIPLYNYYALPLVKKLSCQIAHNDNEYECCHEIVCIDDHSNEESIAKNNGIEDFAKVIRLDENVGRARIRNLFLQYTKGDYLLFLDNDMMVPDNFLNGYVSIIKESPQVVVGGIAYDITANDVAHSLRYMYGTKVESRSAEARKKHPYRSFMTGNFMIRRDVFERILFDESLHKYGHEDTLFGYELKKNHIPIMHIDNQAINGQVEANIEYLRKTMEGVENLAIIYRSKKDDKKFCQSVRLLRTYNIIKCLGLERMVYCMFRKIKDRVERRFAEGKGISLWQFNFYKLGILIKEINN